MKEFFKTIFIKENIFALVLALVGLVFGFWYLAAPVDIVMAMPGLKYVIALGFAAFSGALLAEAYLTARVKDLSKRNEELNRLYQDTVAEKLNYKHEKEDLVKRVLELENMCIAKDKEIQELHDAVQIEGMKDQVKVEATLEQQQDPGNKLMQDIDDIKATIVKVKSRKRNKK